MLARALRDRLRHARRGDRAVIARGSVRNQQDRGAADSRRSVRDERELTRAMRY
jgi:hypothetical protein